MARFNQSAMFKPAKVEHAGLWFDKYLRIQNTDNKETQQKQAHVQSVAALAEPTLYKAFYEDWKASVLACETSGFVVKHGNASTLGRLAIGLGNESTIETSITLHHTYGMPYIPGSALKGLAAHYADQRLGAEWKKGTQAYEILFGYANKLDEEGQSLGADAGFVTFFDALYIPGSGQNGSALHPDIITVHHPDYYNKEEDPHAPADWDSPIPIPFLTATGQFWVALAGPEAWVTAAFMITEWALKEFGVGAKTSSGYGRMILQPPPLDPSEMQAKELIQQVNKLPNQKVANEIQSYANRWRQLVARDELKRLAAQAIIDKVRASGREKKDMEKSWYQELLTFVSG